MANYNKQSTRPLILNILNILKKYSNADHRLSQQDIIDLLRQEYDVRIDRKTVRPNIEALLDLEYPIEYEETKRSKTDPVTGKKEENSIWSDFYLEHEFTDGELRLVIDSLLFSNHISYSQCRGLVEKLEGLSDKYFRSHIKHIYAMKDMPPHNPQIFLNIDTLDEAITSKKQIKFAYGEYGMDGKLHAKTDNKGNIKEYVINPYQMAARDGRYYLICNRDGYKNMSNYRVDRMLDIEVLDKKATPFDKLKVNAGKRLELDDYIRKHIYMYSHEPVNVKFRIDKGRLSDVLDYLGTDIRIYDETDDHVFVLVKADEEGMLQFAQNYAPGIVLLSPKRLVDKMKTRLTQQLEEYNKI